MSSLSSTSITAANLSNSGTIYGPTNILAIAGNTTNSGGLLGTNTLTLSTTSLNNSGGLIFSGDVNNPATATGNTSVTVTGGNGSFNNTGGQILAQNVATLALPNQTIDPSASTFGTVNGGYGLNLSAQSFNNTGTWTLPGTSVTVTATNGINNGGTINQGAGAVTFNGGVTNAGTINTHDLTINGALVNQASGTVQASDAFTLNGWGINRGVVEALNTLAISGSSYDNAGATTKAGNGTSGAGNMTVSLTGDLNNAGGMLSATYDLSITANNVVNSGASATVTTTTTTVVNNPALVMALTVGTDTVDSSSLYGAENGFCCDVYGYPQSVTMADALSPDGLALPLAGFGVASSDPVTTSGTVTFVEVSTGSGTGWFVKTAENASAAIASITVALPNAIETTTTTGAQSGANSVIAAGHDLKLNANTLNNQGGSVSAGNDANVSVQSLSNGGTTYSSTVTDTVDVATINNFLAQAPKTLSIWSSYFGPDGSNGCPHAVGDCIDPAGIQLGAPGTVTPLSTTSSVTLVGPGGQIVAGHDLNLSGGNLVNAGTLAAGNDVHVTAASFTNQGTNTGTMATTAGCAPGFAGCASGATTNPNSQSYSYQQTNATVAAGNDLVIAANSVSNTYGDLVARRNVVIGGLGTSASDSSTNPASLTEASGVTNTSGSISAGNNVDINAATLTNTIAAPVQVHQNYGNGTPFTGCTSNCEAYVDVQSASPATITANHDVNLSAVNFNNTGSLITGLNNVTINATGAASTGNQYEYAYWSSGFTHYGKLYATWGCANNPSLCASLYGGAYDSGASQDPAGLPSSVGLPDFVAATIQAGNTLAIHSPTLTNTGNVVGQTVSLSGSQLVNGLNNPNVYTPPPAVSGQVITLGPPSIPASATTTVNHAGLVTTLSGSPTSVTGAAGLPSNTPIGVTTVGTPVAPTVATATTPTGSTVKTVDGQTVTVNYLSNNPAAAVMGDLTPASLLAALPSNLQPGNVPFYYDPYTEDRQVEQAALQTTGKSSFYSTTSATDSTSQASITYEDKAALYGAALEYAKQNNIALGTQLSDAQLALVNEPMLWYVEETVPQPGCNAIGNGACPTVQALMPEVLLPQNFAVVNADGEITGTNVTLNYANSILNTGSVSAQNLTINTRTLTNEQRSTNIGTIYQEVDGGVEKTTGTMVQQGGFMSAMNYDLQVQSLNQIGGALQKLNADGSVDAAGTQAMLASLKSQLGNQFTESTVSNQLDTTLIADGGMGPLIALQMVILVAISVVTAGAGTGAAIAGFAAGTAEAAAANAAFAALVSSIAGQVMNGQFDVKSIVESVAIAAVTAGITNGVTYNSNTGSFDFSLTQNVNALPSGVSTLGQLAGVSPGVGTTVPQAGSSLAANLPQQALAIGAEATVQAGVQTAIGGGSFLTNLRNSAISDAAAAGAFDIGEAKGSLNQAEYIAAHALLGCAASAANGTGCGGGAIGGAASAAFSPDFIHAMEPSSAPLTSDQQAALGAFATLLGSGLAGLAGQNVSGGATAAQNEALNNAGQHPGQGGLMSALLDNVYTFMPWLPGSPVRQGLSAGLDSLSNGTIFNTDNSDTKTPNNGEPGSWHINPGSGQERLYGPDGYPEVDIDSDHDHGQGNPHAHNWEPNPNGGFPARGPGVPVSPWVPTPPVAP
ncbi:beta strand repeat-containing protein [Paraburkholderia terrae]